MLKLTPEDVGERVTVRRRTPEGLGSDIVGDLESWLDGVLAIRDRDGARQLVPAEQLVAGRVVAPSPRAAAELQGVSARGWPAPDTELLGQWMLRAAGGFTARANAVRPLGSPDLELDDALARVEAWYRERELPPAVQVVVGSSLDRRLAARGWSADPEVSVMTATLHRLQARLAGATSSADAVEIADSPSSGWLSLFRGGDAPPAGVAILTGAKPRAFALLPSDCGSVAIGRAAVEPPWVGLTAIEVAGHARRQGHAKAVIAALVRWAAGEGALRAYLEVSVSNTPAVALYESLGFAEHHRYARRRRE